MASTKHQSPFPHVDNGVENEAALNKMIDAYDSIMMTIQSFDPFSGSQVLCNVLNDHIKSMSDAIEYHNRLAAEMERSMEALADGLRRLRLTAQDIVNNTNNQVIRLSSKSYGDEDSEQ
ncbi:hypothetical protein LX64_02450 [Chitinophaga skermanii]|uniref:Uncharacterized protein n=1 Tax=Chitinophaga skermanii TaxID=331697 RepID=A0A327QPL6_9BACT|nr:hypothetical protein [Chitinophaga skermanii]RAJ05293.1 hypothetical protein LX64_02450 [Chitinophaga skermanii]